MSTADLSPLKRAFLALEDMKAFVYPSLTNKERKAVLPGLTFFTAAPFASPPGVKYP